MGLTDWLFGNKKKSLLSQPPRFTVIGGRVISVGSDLVSNVTEGYEGIGTIYSMVKIMTDKAGAIPRYLYKTTADRGKKMLKVKQWSPQNHVKTMLLSKAMTEVEMHEFLMLLDSLGPQFIKQVLGYRYITGNCYIRKVCGQAPGTDPGNSKPVDLQILPAQYMDIITDDASPWSVTGYRLQATGVVQQFHPNEIIHFKYPNYSWDGFTKQHLYGMSPLKAATMDITTAKYLKMAQASQAQNEGAKGLIVRNDDYEITEDQRDAIQLRTDQEVNNARHRGKAVVTNANVRWEQIGLSSAEMELVKTFQLGKEDLANIYNFPIHLLSSVTSTFNNVEAAIKYLTTNTIWGDVMDFQDMLNRELLQKYWGQEMVLRYDISDMPEIADDINKMGQTLKDLYWLTLNERRFVMKWDDRDDPNMDEIIVPSGYIPLERVFEDPMAMMEQGAGQVNTPRDSESGTENR